MRQFLVRFLVGRNWVQRNPCNVAPAGRGPKQAGSPAVALVEKIADFHA